MLAAPLARAATASVARDQGNAVHIYAAFDVSMDDKRSNIFSVDIVMRYASPDLVHTAASFDAAKDPHELHYYHSSSKTPLELTAEMAAAIRVAMQRNRLIIKEAHDRVLMPEQRQLFRAAMNAVDAALYSYAPVL